ncbi:Tim10/DDP family zinc finger-domain-containing protein [Lipomyces japonicus]|uniref:Tim10/DDP family zinc finger-domain-containing protein n=1 Tax=Lipomyces japonicus TaxID=56871 RepID=UPI0034CE65BD
MSFLGLGRPATDYDEQKINNIKGEMLMMSKMKDTVQVSCLKKCLPDYYNDGDLNKGESNCVDRCVGKFFETIKLVGTEMQKLQSGGQ